jgi:hypothetical protein
MPGDHPTLIWPDRYRCLGLGTMGITVTASSEGAVLADIKSPSDNALAALANSSTS